MSTRSLQSFVLKAIVQATVQNDQGSDPVRVATAALNHVFNPSMSDGTGTNQANRAWDYAGNLATSGTLVIDLYDFGTIDGGSGAGKDILGQSLALSEIVGIMIINTTDEGSSDSSGPGTLEIIPDTTAGWAPIGSHTVANGGALEPGGVLFKAQPDINGFVVTDAVSHRIKLTANGGPVDFQIIVIGRQ